MLLLYFYFPISWSNICASLCHFLPLNLSNTSTWIKTNAFNRNTPRIISLISPKIFQEDRLTTKISRRANKENHPPLQTILFTSITKIKFPRMFPLKVSNYFARSYKRISANNAITGSASQWKINVPTMDRCTNDEKEQSNGRFNGNAKESSVYSERDVSTR